MTRTAIYSKDRVGMETRGWRVEIPPRETGRPKKESRSLEQAHRHCERLGNNFVTCLGNYPGSTAEHHLEVLGLDIDFAAASFAESSGLRCSEEACTSFRAVAELDVGAVNGAGIGYKDKDMCGVRIWRYDAGWVLVSWLRTYQESRRR